jgi:hypothetical protein
LLGYPCCIQEDAEFELVYFWNLRNKL